MFEERGLSDVIAFVLTFSVIILSVSAVSVLGVSQLTEVRDREQVNSAERSMVSFAKNLDDVSQQGDRMRAGEIALQDGHVHLADASLRLRINETTNSSGNWTRSVTVNTLQHRLEKSFGAVNISYENGAVFRQDIAADEESRMRYRPTMRCAPDTGIAVVTLVALNGSLSIGSGSPGFSVGPEDAPGADAPVEDSEQSVQLSGTLNKTESKVIYVNRSDGTGKTVFLDLSETTNTDGWRAYLDDGDTGWESAADDDYGYKCGSGNLETVVVRLVTIDVTVDE